MKPTTVTVFDLFQSERRNIVPLFQRPYVWSKDKQWQPLWDDVTALANQVLSQPQEEHAQLHKHFIGAVVLNQIKTFGLQLAAWEIIDGQQRLTTLQILLFALRDYMQAHQHTSQARSIKRITINDTDFELPYEQFKVWPTTVDQLDFENVFNAGSPTALATQYPQTRIPYTTRWTPRPLLVEAYLFFSQAISEYVSEQTMPVTDATTQEPSANSQPLDALVTAITKYLEIVVIELEERDDPQVIFETLNARGEPLLPSDLIRNFVFLEASRKKEDVSRLYHTYWQPFDHDGVKGPGFWKALERQGRLNRPRLDLFFFNYLTYKSEKEIAIPHLFAEFRGWWSKRPKQSVEADLKDLQRYSDLFVKFSPSVQQTRLDILAHRIRLLDTSTVYPLLLMVLGEHLRRPRSGRHFYGHRILSGAQNDLWLDQQRL